MGMHGPHLGNRPLTCNCSGGRYWVRILLPHWRRYWTQVVNYAPDLRKRDLVSPSGMDRIGHFLTSLLHVVAREGT